MTENGPNNSSTVNEETIASTKGAEVVFKVSAAIALLIATSEILFNERFAHIVGIARNFLQVNFHAVYIYGIVIFLFFSIVLAFSKFGKIRLGGPDAQPDYSAISWFGMLFTAGMGIGLIFYGISEPVSHYFSPWAEITPMTESAAQFGIRSSFTHWGALAWGCYAITGLGLAYFMHNRHKPCMFSETLQPILGKFTKGSVGKSIDIYVTIFTCIGVAVPFGMGTLQVSSGLNYLFGVPSNVYTWLAIVVVIASIFILSAVIGIDKGIRRISDLTLVLTLALLVLTFFVGPKSEVLSTLVFSTVDFAKNFFPETIQMQSNGSTEWVYNWRIFFWAFFFSWAPFVGTFIARISRGRTIREFLLAVIVVPSLFTVIWFSVFGTLGFNVIDLFDNEQLKHMVAHPETMMFVVYDKYPLGFALSVIAVIDLTFFFITSANSGTFVLAMFSSNGNMNPPKRKLVFWGILVSAIGFGLIISGSIGVAQTTIIAIGFPFIFIMALMAISLVKAIVEDTAAEKSTEKIFTEDLLDISREPIGVVPAMME